MSRTGLITPPPEREEIYPYRRAWRSIILEALILLTIVVIIFVLSAFLGVTFPPNIIPTMNLVLALLPLLLWFGLSWLPERLAPQPRARLSVVMILGALAANAVALPMLHQFYQIETWLPLADTLSRVIGYTFTLGIVQAAVMYFVIRYTVWRNLRVWSDAVAYAAACAIGYTTTQALYLINLHTVTPDTAALFIFASLSQTMLTALIVAYGIADSAFSPSSVAILPFMVALSAIVIGIIVPLRGAIANAGFVLGVSAPSLLLSLVIDLAVLFGLGTVMAFFYTSAEQRNQEVIRNRET
jgi:hypothetical protein